MWPNLDFEKIRTQKFLTFDPEIYNFQKQLLFRFFYSLRMKTDFLRLLDIQAVL